MKTAGANMTLQKYSKYVIFDMPNTLLDSRHRSDDRGYSMTGIRDDKVNYPAILMLNTLLESNFKVILTHYCLSRLREQVEMCIKRNNLQDKYYKLFTNFNTQDVYDNQTLKRHLYEQILADYDVTYVIDNDPQMKAYWLNNEVALIQIPLGIY